jgi:hypothetical protein
MSNKKDLFGEVDFLQTSINKNDYEKLYSKLIRKIEQRFKHAR